MIFVELCAFNEGWCKLTLKLPKFLVAQCIKDSRGKYYWRFTK